MGIGWTLVVAGGREEAFHIEDTNLGIIFREQ